MSNLIFTDKDHSWVIPFKNFNYSVTIPIHEIRLEYSTINEFSTLDFHETFKRLDEIKRKDIYEILDLMKSLNALYDVYHIYVMGGSHIASGNDYIKDEIKAIETLRTWINLYNQLGKLLEFKKELEWTDQIIVKTARETRPTVFDNDGNILELSPYENNTKLLKEKKITELTIKIQNKIKELLVNQNEVFTV